MALTDANKKPKQKKKREGDEVNAVNLLSYIHITEAFIQSDLQ